jgi:hypothetical protein
MHVEYESLSDMMQLGLSRKEINTFYKCFLKIDKAKQKCFQITDFLNYLNVEVTPLVIQVFGELDLSTDGMLNFREVCWLVFLFDFLLDPVCRSFCLISVSFFFLMVIVYFEYLEILCTP